MNKYKQVIYWSEEEHKFIVEVPELPGCMADGMTEAEALKNTEQIVSEWVETARILGRKVPQPEGKVVYMWQHRMDIIESLRCGMRIWML